MKKLFAPVMVVLVVAVLVAAGGCAGVGQSGPVATDAVSIETSSFSPPAIVVKVGDTVTWTNRDSRVHNVTGDGFDSGTIYPNATFTHVFESSGEAAYYDRYLPSLTGKVSVQ